MGIKNDLPEVVVRNNDVEFAIKVLKRAMGSLGIMRAIKIRRDHPAPGDRQRHKRRLALNRMRKVERKQAEMGARYGR